jgi:hypothetical protein
LGDLKVTHQKNQPHPSLEKNELPPKKIKIKIKKCPGTRAQGCGALVPWYQGSHLRTDPGSCILLDRVYVK